MDSREMYNATHHIGSQVTWAHDWIHFGTNEAVKIELVRQLIDENLGDGELLFIHNRTTSGQYKREEVEEVIMLLLGREDFQLWTSLMDKVIKFAAMGVLNVGKRA